jgi:hypothetical protein
MSSPTSAAATPVSNKPFCPGTWLRPHLTVYHLTVASVLGGITVVFFTVIALLIITSINFNVLGWVE